MSHARPDPHDPAEQWRLGTHYAVHVYAKQRPVATFHSADDAAQAVVDHNAMARLRSGAPGAYQDGAVWHEGEPGQNPHG